MKNIEITIKVDIKETGAAPLPEDGVGKLDDGLFRLVLESEAVMDIGALEAGLLRTNYPALRDALAHYLEQTSKNKVCRESEQTGSGGTVLEHASRYRVDGEIGRIEFSVFDVKTGEGDVILKGPSLFAFRQGKQWYQTCGFKEMAVLNGAAQRNYRETVRVFNHIRRQESGGTALNTPRDGAEAEGLKVIDFLENKSQRILREHGFDAQGVAETPYPGRGQTADTAPGVLEQESIARGLDAVCRLIKTLSRVAWPRKRTDAPVCKTPWGVSNIVAKG